MNCSRNDVVLLPIPFPMEEWRAAGLNVASGVKAQVSTVDQSLIVKIVGSLGNADRQTLDKRLRSWLDL